MQKKIRARVGNNNGQLRIATPPRVAHAKPPGPKKKEKRGERPNDGNNNGQLRIATPRKDAKNSVDESSWLLKR